MCAKDAELLKVWTSDVNEAEHAGLALLIRLLGTQEDGHSDSDEEGQQDRFH